jgi:hypothetical protein
VTKKKIRDTDVFGLHDLKVGNPKVGFRPKTALM